MFGDCQLASAGEGIDVDEGMRGCSGHVDRGDVAKHKSEREQEVDGGLIERRDQLPELHDCFVASCPESLG